MISETLRFPTPTLLITNVGTLCMSPDLFKKYPKLFRSVQLGMNLDDFFDFEVNPRPLCGDNYPNIERHSENRLYLNYTNSLRIAENGCDNTTELSNLRWFTAKINLLEGTSISTAKEDWTFDKVKKYREDVALVWAIFLSSLHSEKETIDIRNIDDQLGFNGQKILDWANFNNGEHIEEKKSTLKLYYSALVFQVVSDYGKKDHSNRNFIPNFFLNDDFTNRSVAQLKHYIEMSIKSGCNKQIIYCYVNSFNIIQKMLSTLSSNKKYKEWLYS